MGLQILHAPAFPVDGRQLCRAIEAQQMLNANCETLVVTLITPFHQFGCCNGRKATEAAVTQVL